MPQVDNTGREALARSYDKADAALALVRDARRALLQAVRENPDAEYNLEPVWRHLAQVEGELAASIDRLADDYVDLDPNAILKSAWDR